MTYVAIMSVADNRVAKFREFETKKEANAHVAAFADRWPDAFVVNAPAANVSDWWVDGRAVSVVQPPPEPDPEFARQAAKEAEFEAIASKLGYVKSETVDMKIDAARVSAGR